MPILVACRTSVARLALPFGAMALALFATPALADPATAAKTRPNVTVDLSALDEPATATTAAEGDIRIDLGVLDTLPPSDGTAAPIKLHRPVVPVAAVAPPHHLPKTSPAPAATAPVAAAPAPAAAPTEETAAATAAPVEAAPAPAPVVPAAAPAAVGAEVGVTVRFAAGDAQFGTDTTPALDRVAAQFAGNPRLHLQLLAYAAAANDASQARRLSLQRAIALRNYLVDHGVPATRIEIHALGNRSDGGEASDRVDLTIVER